VTLRQLEYRVTVARSGSFTLAAEQLHVSQPTLSQRIRALEAEVEAQLIERLATDPVCKAASFQTASITSMVIDRSARPTVLSRDRERPVSIGAGPPPAGDQRGSGAGG
jgi:hypothetical protein